MKIKNRNVILTRTFGIGSVYFKERDLLSYKWKRERLRDKWSDIHCTRIINNMGTTVCVVKETPLQITKQINSLK